MSTENTFDQKPIILIVCNYYLPGYKTGGGLRTLVHMVERFRDRFDFRVITRDHDGDEKPYDTVKINEWNEIDGAKVYYLSKDRIKLSSLRKLIEEIKPNSIYVNSVFATLTIFLLTLRKLKLIPQTNIILAPEGELSDGALQLKAKKKKTFTKFARATGLYQNLIWKTTAELEKQETEKFKGLGGKIFVAPNMPTRHLLRDYRQEMKPKKKVGEAKMIFLSRFMRKKNFGWLVEHLKNVEGNLIIDIFGPLEDKDYWNETSNAISDLPKNIEVKYKGHITYEEVPEKLFEYQYFILPTSGENFGHVFIEALAAGCPLIISDRTPWLKLEKKGVGWDIPLEKPERWVEIINFCIKTNNINYEKISSRSREFACRWLADPKIETDTLTVLNYSISNGQ